jgi:hypothetical protein
MQLTEKILELIYTNLVNIPYITDRYDTLAPDEAIYPFVVYTELPMSAFYDFTCTYNKVNIQFSVYNDKDPEVIEKILGQIENIFHYNTSLAFSGQTHDYRFVCSHKIRQGSTNKLKDNDNKVYWMATVDYQFLCSRSNAGIV